MRFGLFFLAGSPSEDHVRDYGEILEQIEVAEELGYHSVWLAEHHGSSYSTTPAPSVLAAAASQRTKRIKIGVAVTILPFQNPVRVAEEWAMVDVLSNGRLLFGAGRGYQEREFHLMRAEPTESREVFAESLEIILRLWAGERVTYRGKHFSFDEAEIFPKPVQRPIPTWLAALSPQTMGLVAQHGLNLLMTPVLSPLDDLKQHAIAAMRQLVAAGRSPESIDFPMNVAGFIGPSVEEAQATVKSAYEWHFRKIVSLYPGAGGKDVKPGYEGYADSVRQLERMLETGEPWLEPFSQSGNILIGGPEEARTYVRALRDDIGLKHLNLAMAVGGLPHETVIDSMRRFAEEVMPEFAHLDSPLPAAVTAP